MDHIPGVGSKAWRQKLERACNHPGFTLKLSLDVIAPKNLPKVPTGGTKTARAAAGVERRRVQKVNEVRVFLMDLATRFESVSVKLVGQK